MNYVARVAYLRPLGRATLIVTGEDRVRFLHGMVSNDIEKLRPGQGCHAAMLTTKGKLLGDLVVYAEEGRLVLSLDGSLRDKLKGALERHIVMDDVEIADVSDTVRPHGVYGDDAAEAVARALGLSANILAELPNYHQVCAEEVRVARTPELGMLGFHVLGDVTLDGTPMSEAEWEERRIEAGTPRYGVDMGEDRLPIEARLDDAVDFKKGCYLGQEVIARATNLGHINRRLSGLVVDGDAPPAAGTKLSAASRPEAGFITSAVHSRRLKQTLALGYVHRTLWDAGTKLLLADGREATVVALPFVENSRTP
jgi:folate-binding protein YgfZ